MEVRVVGEVKEMEWRDLTFLSVDVPEVAVWVDDVSYSALKLFGF